MEEKENQYDPEKEEGSAPEPEMEEGSTPETEEMGDADSENGAVEEAPEMMPNEGEEEVPTEGEAETQQPEQEADERTFTQAEVDKIVGKIRSEARERAVKELLNKYGYDDVSQLDETVGESERYAELSGQQDEMESLRNENLLLRSGITEDRFEDAMAYFAYKDLPMNPITLEEAIESHPEWVDSYDDDYLDEEEDSIEEEKPSMVRRLGAEPIRKDDGNPAESEEDRAMFMFGLGKRG